MACWKYVLKYGGLYGFAVSQPSVFDCFADDELVGAPASYEIDDAFAVDADLFDEFIIAV